MPRNVKNKVINTRTSVVGVRPDTMMVIRNVEQEIDAISEAIEDSNTYALLTTLGDVNVSSGVTTTVNFSLVDTNASDANALRKLNLSNSRGEFTNTGTDTQLYYVHYQLRFADNINAQGTRFAYVSLNSSNSRIYGLAPSMMIGIANTVINLSNSVVIRLAPNDSFSIVAFQTNNSTLKLIANNIHGTRLIITAM